MTRTARLRRFGARFGVMTVALSLAFVTIGPPPAQAADDVNHPRQAWMRDATAGLFLHWGLRTDRGPGKPPFGNSKDDCRNWENEITRTGWNANYWVQEAQKLHTQYLVLATFHSRLGYARNWPSMVPGSCSTRRDFLGETIAAAKAKGLKVMLYLTDDARWYWEGLREMPPDPRNPDPGDVNKPNWFDSTAYTKFKGNGKFYNLTTRADFGAYSYDNFLEVIRNYPDLSGLWIDNVNPYWTDPRNDPSTKDPARQVNLWGKIRQARPDWVLVNNGTDSPDFDAMSNEQKFGMTPAYDYAAALVTPGPRLIESDYKLPNEGGWWYDGEEPGRAGQSPVDKKLVIGRMISNVGSSSKALEAETAKLNGRFPQNQADFNNFANGYLDKIWESINGVEGGGYLYGGLQPGAFNDGAYGYTTIGKANKDLHYVHVIDRAAGDVLKVRDNGYVVDKVTDVRTGAPFAFTQRDGTLTINGVGTWDDYDTVFRVQTNGRTGLHPDRSLAATATVAAAGHGADALVDGDHTTWWDNNVTLPASLTIDLKTVQTAAYLAINQREWSPTHRRGSQDSARIKGYSVQASTDGTTWTTVVGCATMRSARGVQFIDLGAASARYVRLTVNSTWAAASGYANKLRIDEVRVGSAYPGGGTGPAVATGGEGYPPGAR